MSKTLEALRAWAPLAIVAAGLVGTGYVTLDRQGAIAADVADLTEDVEHNEEAIDLIQRRLIERQGEVELRTQRIEIEQRAQGEDLEQILNLLQQIQRENLGGD